MKEKLELSLGSIYKNSWELLKKNYGQLILLVVLGALLVGVFVIPGGLALILGIGGFKASDQIHFNAYSIIGIIIFTIAVLIAMLASIVYSVALVKAIGNADEGKQINLKDVFRYGYDNFWKVLWASLISGLIILAGFILLVIPGFVAAIFLQFVVFAVIFDKKLGYDASKESYGLVKGHFGMVLVIFLSVVILQGAISWIPGVGSLAAFLLTPFWQVITYMTYKSLKSMKGKNA